MGPPAQPVTDAVVRDARFPGEPADVPAARRFVREAVGGTGTAGLEKAVLATSELVSNAIRHAGTPLGVRVIAHRLRLRVEVEDGSSRLPEERHPTPAEPTGRGLQIVRQCAHRWGVTPLHGGGKVVWFEVDRDRQVDPARAADVVRRPGG